MTEGIRILPVRGLPEVRRGDDLAALIAERADLHAGDVVVVAQKAVSKAEGATEASRPGEAPREARRRIARERASRVVADTPQVLITETPHGLVCANGGVDGSNAPDGMWVLLPDDPDASARDLREGLRARAGFDVPVVVTDTFGRPWRRGQTDVAIGVSGLAAIRDERGGVDRQGAELEVTEAAVADELAAAADLVRRKADGVPVVVVRGFEWSPDERAAARDLVRPAGEDLFRRGAGMLGRALADAAGTARAGAVAADGPFDRQAPRAPLTTEEVASAQEVAAASGATVTAESGEDATVLTVDGDRLAAGLVIAALLDRGCHASWQDDGGRLIVRADRPSADRPAR